MRWINFSDDVKKVLNYVSVRYCLKKVHITPKIDEDDTKQFIDMNVYTSYVIMSYTIWMLFYG